MSSIEEREEGSVSSIEERRHPALHDDATARARKRLRKDVSRVRKDAKKKKKMKKEKKRRRKEKKEKEREMKRKEKQKRMKAEVHYLLLTLRPPLDAI